MLRILIFGATSAIAQAVARQWVERGDAVFLVGRDAAKLAAIAADLGVRAQSSGRVGAIQADLDDVARHADSLDAARSFLGSIDVVLIAQGTLPDQAGCERDVSMALRALHTNGLAVVALCAAVANVLQAQGHGTLAVISSVAGDRGRASNYTYGAAKGLVSTFLQGLRGRLHRHGVHVVTIKPGFVDTPMTAGLRKGALWVQPAEIARGILKAVDRRRDVVYLPGFWRAIMLVILLIPERMFKRLPL